MNILAELRSRFKTVLAEYEGQNDELLELIRPAGNPKFGDYQANLSMPLGKKLGKPAPQIAADLVAKLSLDDMCETAQVAGPGFINLKLKPAWVQKQLSAAFQDQRLGVEKTNTPRKVVIDFSSPNVAKPMHVGHIRSTVIGDALARTMRFLGHDVITDNHLGDWGTQFGMIIYGFKHFLNQEAYQEAPITELGKLYREVRRLMDYHSGKANLPKLLATSEKQQQAIAEIEAKLDSLDKAEKKKQKAERNRLIDKQAELEEKIGDVRQLIEAIEADSKLSAQANAHADINTAVLGETAKLHAGDEENLQLWNDFLPICLEDLHRIYDKMGVTFDHELGESFYHDKLTEIVELFKQKGIAQQSEGAICVFLDGFDAPMLIQKQDGAFLYATSDLATIRYRMENWQPEIVLYVVDHRQHEHFAKLFAAAKIWGYDDVQLRHIEFGTVMGDDGKPFRTRAGDIVGLEGLVDEAIRRAAEVVKENAAKREIELAPEQCQRIAAIVGKGALKYADLSQNRSTDYKFSYDKMLKLTGNTGPYLQYSYARTQGIFRKGEIDVAKLRADGAPISLEHPAERNLAISILQLEEALEEVLVDYRPNLLCNYVYALSKAYSSFFEECPVLQAPDEASQLSRLKLCDLSARAVRQCLDLLGMEVSDQM